MQQPEIFISYAWGGESEKIVDVLYATFKSKGYEIIRDKINLGYKGSITAFMDRIGQGKYVIVVISEKYLKSENCMYEIVQVAKNGQFKDRIFPVVLENANIYQPINRIKYIKYWEEKKKEFNEQIKTLDDLSITPEIHKELGNYNEIYQSMSNILAILKDMNTLTPDIHQNTHFEELFKAIDAKIESDKKLDIPITPIKSNATHSPLIASKDYCFYIEGVLFELIYVEGGTYQMGYDPKRDGEDKDMEASKPLQTIEVKSFWIGKYPVTQEQWQVVIGDNPSYFKGEKLPVEMVSWEDCQEFCNKLKRKIGKPFRLPTEEEWEYAARGGRESEGYRYAGSNNINRVAWYEENSNAQTHTVGQKEANELGIYDMSGNVWEWTYSYWSKKNYRKKDNSINYILRGGAWGYINIGSLIAFRRSYQPISTNISLGFRICISE